MTAKEIQQQIKELQQKLEELKSPKHGDIVLLNWNNSIRVIIKDDNKIMAFNSKGKKTSWTETLQEVIYEYGTYIHMGNVFND